MKIWASCNRFISLILKTLKIWLGLEMGENHVLIFNEKNIDKIIQGWIV